MKPTQNSILPGRDTKPHGLQSVGLKSAVFTRRLSSHVLTVLVLLAAIACGSPALRAEDLAVTGVIKAKPGFAIQKVGFRAFILKGSAIELNLAGWATNQQDGTVEFAFQGDAQRIHQAIETIKEGHKKSKDHVESVTVKDAKLDPKLRTFTVLSWTSHSRSITNKPYDLVFTLRADGTQIEKDAAKKVFNKILKDTLDDADYRKLRPEDLDY